MEGRRETGAAPAPQCVQPPISPPSRGRHPAAVARVLRLCATTGGSPELARDEEILAGHHALCQDLLQRRADLRAPVRACVCACACILYAYVRCLEEQAAAAAGHAPRTHAKGGRRPRLAAPAPVKASALPAAPNYTSCSLAYTEAQSMCL